MCCGISKKQKNAQIFLEKGLSSQQINRYC